MRGAAHARSWAPSSVVYLETERRALHRTQQRSFAVEQLQPFGEPPIAVQIQFGVARVEQARIEAKRPERPVYRLQAEVRIDHSERVLELRRGSFVDKKIPRGLVADVVGADRHVRRAARQHDKIEIAARTTALGAPRLACLGFK